MCRNTSLLVASILLLMPICAGGCGRRVQTPQVSSLALVPYGIQLEGTVKVRDVNDSKPRPVHIVQGELVLEFENTSDREYKIQLPPLRQVHVYENSICDISQGQIEMTNAAPRIIELAPGQRCHFSERYAGLHDFQRIRSSRYRYGQVIVVLGAPHGSDPDNFLTGSIPSSKLKWVQVKHRGEKGAGHQN